MNNCVKAYAKNIRDMKDSDFESYLNVEAQIYYEFEDKHIFPRVINTDDFIAFIEEFKKYKHVFHGLKQVTKLFLEYLNLSDLNIRITTNKAGESYFHANKKAIFLHKDLFEDIKNNPEEDCHYDILILVFFHEIAHAYTYYFFDTDASHNNLYMVNLIKILSIFLERDVDFFYKKDIELDDKHKYPAINKEFHKQPFLTGHNHYIQELFCDNEDEINTLVDDFLITHKESIKKHKYNVQFYKGFANTRNYKIKNKYGVDIYSMVVLEIKNGFKVFKFDKPSLDMDELFQLEIFKRRNNKLTEFIIDNPYLEIMESQKSKPIT